MRRLLARQTFHFTVLLIFLLLGCDQEDQVKYKIGFSQCVSNDQWRQQMHEEMNREISFYPELSLEIKDAEGSSSLQARQIQEFIDEGVDLLIVSPNEADPITPPVEKAFNLGIPVIVIDRKTSSSLYTAYVGADNLEVGKTAGNYIAKKVKPGDTVVEIWGLRGSTPAVNRDKGFLQALDTSMINFIPVYSDWTKETAKEKFREALRKHQDIDVVFAHNDMMALGAYQVAGEMGLEEKISFYGVDGLAGSAGGLQFVLDGILDATFLYPTGGEEAIKIAHDILKNRSYHKENSLQTTTIDETNVRIMKQQTDKILTQQRNIERQQNKILEQIKIYRNQRTALYLLVISLTISIVLGAYAMYALRERKEAYKKLNQQNEKVRRQKQKIEEMAVKAEEATQAKFKFFTNISHEFRTPLTLILAPLEELLTVKRIVKDKFIHQDLLLIKKNTLRLLRLISQLMDFRKIENERFKLNVSEQDIVHFVKDIKQAFDMVAGEREIDYRFICAENESKAWFDRNVLDKVIFNLLSNAFKFTNNKGLIHVSLELYNGQAIIKVRDNGNGMSEEHVNHAFDRFYQGDINLPQGSGLGLALSKELISLHKGDIFLESKKGKGSTFTINLPVARENYSKQEIKPEISTMLTREQFTNYADELSEIEYLEPQKKVTTEQTLLLIEDNNELVKFLKNHLLSNYNVLEADSGEKGIDLAIDEIPDLIICDIMMEGKNGLDVTQNLKLDYRTSHIPIILLTARSSDEQVLEGLQVGADLYITKPFSVAYLQESIRSLLKNRDILKAHYLVQSETHEEESKGQELNIDQKFINKFKKIVEDNLSNPEFSVKDICEEIGFSRVQLYRKVKAILGCSISDYITEKRLKKARLLLSNSNMNISEIAYETGFSSPGYFSTAFKNYFNISPSDFKMDKMKLD